MASRRIVDLRLLAQRLADGSGSPADLQRVFLGLRSYDFGNAVFREIGDFVAHSDERDQGVVTDRARDFMRVFRMMLMNLGRLPSKLSHDELAATLRSALRVRSDAGLSKSLGYSREIANSVLGALIRKIGGVDGGPVQILRALTQREGALLSELLGVMEFTTAITEEDLLAGFKFVLRKNGVISEPELLNHLGPELSAFAVSYMHRAHILSPEGDELALYTVVSATEIHVIARVVKASTSMPDISGDAMPIFMFNSQTPPHTICEAEMFGQDGGPEKELYWLDPVDLTAEFKLRWL